MQKYTVYCLLNWFLKLFQLKGGGGEIELQRTTETILNKNPFKVQHFI